MSIRAQISKEALNSAEKAKVHFIPASIDGNGPIKISEYFDSYQSEENAVQINALRGFPLKGVEVMLPENIKGVVVQEIETLQIDGAERELKFSGVFDKFTYWNYDKNPSENDGYRKAMHWVKVADALHAEVESLDD